jgi:hypothetical protein
MELGFKSVVLALVVLVCLLGQATSQDSSSVSSIVDDARQSFQNESIFKINPWTGMSPGVPARGVWYPPVAGVALPSANVAGNWALDLRDVTVRSMSLNLSQNGNSLVGQGVGRTGNLVQQASVAGTVSGTGVFLYVTPTGGQDLYRLSLTLSSTSLNGDYIYSIGGYEQPGVAFGSRTSYPGAAYSPQQQTAPVQVPVSAQVPRFYYIQPGSTMPLGPKNQIIFNNSV